MQPNVTEREIMWELSIGAGARWLSQAPHLDKGTKWDRAQEAQGTPGLPLKT